MNRFLSALAGACALLIVTPADAGPFGDRSGWSQRQADADLRDNSLSNRVRDWWYGTDGDGSGGSPTSRSRNRHTNGNGADERDNGQ
jgi:hypothetical protein